MTTRDLLMLTFGASLGAFASMMGLCMLGVLKLTVGP